VDVIADMSLFVIAALLTWSLYVDLSQAFPGVPGDGVLIAATAGGGLFFGSIFLHELSHSLVALQRGLTVHRIRLFLFGGISEIEEEAESPSDELAVTLAGPAASFALGVAFLLAAWPLSAAWDVAARLGLILGFANLSIAVFNLLPGLPLDGGRMLRALAWRRTGDRSRATRLAVMTGRGIGVLLMVAGGGLVVVTGEISAIWLAAVGWFLFEAAATSAVQEAFAKRIEGLTLADVMRPTELAINGDSTVVEALELHGWGEKLHPMPVAVDGRVTGVFGTRDVVAVPPDERASTPVRDAMTIIGPDDVIAGDVALRRALARHTGGSGLIVVVEAGEVVGLLTGEEMAGILGDLRRGE
jgi:Zn-dependent protease